jgi:hypothetical protein
MEKITIDVDEVGLIFINQKRRMPLHEGEEGNNYIRLDREDCINLIADLAKSLLKL